MRCGDVEPDGWGYATVQGAAQYGMDPNQFAQIIDQSGQNGGVVPYLPLNELQRRAAPAFSVSRS